MIRVLGIGLGVLLATSAMAAPDDALTRGFDDCFAAVTSGNGLFALAAYGMVPDGSESAEPRVFQGKLQSELGEASVQAVIRDGLLVECAMGRTVPAIGFQAAEDSVAVWFDWLDSTGLSQDLEQEAPQLARVLCLPDLSDTALQISATEQGAAPTGLHFAVTMTDPGNFKQCG